MSDTPPITPTRMAGWWGRSAETSVENAAATAALWNFDCDTPVEIFAEPDRTTHILCLHTRSFTHETFYDGHRVHWGQTRMGGASLVPAGRRPRAVLRSTFGCLHLYLPVGLIQAVAERDSSARREVELIDPECAFDTQLWRIGQAVIGGMIEDAFSSRLAFDALSQALVAHLLSRWSNLTHSAAQRLNHEPGRLAPWQIKRALATIGDLKSEDLPLARLAAEVQLSPFHFARSFKRSVGMPPHRYQVMLRVEAARGLLSETDLPVIEVAAQVGYADPSHFAKVFKREVGLSPLAYRRERRP